MSIPVEFQFMFKEKLKELQYKGNKIDIKILIENKVYIVKLINQKFNENEYCGNKDIIQIRYTEKSDLSKHLKNL
jgi:hypothetical protein